MKPPQSRRVSSSSTLPRYNERRVLRVIRRMGEASKADLARQTNLTNTAVGTIVSNLHRQQLLTVSQKRLSHGFLQHRSSSGPQLDPSCSD